MSHDLPKEERKKERRRQILKSLSNLYSNPFCKLKETTTKFKRSLVFPVELGRSRVAAKCQDINVKVQRDQPSQPYEGTG